MKQTILIIFVLFAITPYAFAQNLSGSVRNGNKLYKQNNFGQSALEYKKALSQSPQSPVLNYNLGNAQFRSKEIDEAVRSYETTIKNSGKQTVKQKAFYNKGVALNNQQKLQGSIEAWKNALKLDPADEEARENLQKALSQQKKQQKENQKNKENEEKNKDPKKQDKNDQAPEQKNKLSKKQVEQLLKALAQKEKEVQQKMQSKNASPVKQEKDW